MSLISATQSCGPSSAVIAAAQQRLRPILLTTATTAGGLLPLWLGGGPLFAPMAVTILFGAVFMVLKGYEYHHHWVEGQLPGRLYHDEPIVLLTGAEKRGHG